MGFTGIPKPMFSLHQCKKLYSYSVTLTKSGPQFLCYHWPFFGIKTIFESHRDHASYLLFTASTNCWKIFHFFSFSYMSWYQSILSGDLNLPFPGYSPEYMFSFHSYCGPWIQICILVFLPHWQGHTYLNGGPSNLSLFDSYLFLRCKISSYCLQWILVQHGDKWKQIRQ